MPKTDCIVCNQDGILTNGSNLNISADSDGEKFICLECLEKQIEHNDDGGGLRIFEKDSVCDFCFNKNGESFCISCLVKIRHSSLNGFLTVAGVKPL